MQISIEKCVNFDKSGKKSADKKSVLKDFKVYLIFLTAPHFSKLAALQKNNMAPEIYMSKDKYFPELSSRY